MSSIKNFLLKQVAEKNIPPDKAKELFEDFEKCSSQKDVKIAVAGMACRFPDAASPDEYFTNLAAKFDSVKSFPTNRVIDAVYVNEDTFQKFNGFKCRVGTYLDKVCSFDCSFFGVPPAEAKAMDPVHRIFLQVAYEAIENSGLTLEEFKGSRTGIFVGYSVGEDNYIDLLRLDDPNVSIGNQPSLLPYRLGYFLDSKGPTMVVDTACSSSLVAVHQAVSSIQRGDCDQAIVGGMNLRIFPAIREISNLGIEAYDGRCKTFDEAANGTNIGEGVGVVILRRMSDFSETSLPPIALIAGSAINSDGRSNGLTAPTPNTQTDVIIKAWERSNLSINEVDFIEAHGTGTKLGDPIEILGITQAFEQLGCTRKNIPLTAAKTSVGHLEAAAGIAGLISVLLCMKNKKIPGNAHFHVPNSYIDFEASPVYPNVETKKIRCQSSTIKAGVSSFGISGTNAHIVLESVNTALKKSVDQKSKEEKIFLFSAKSLNALRGLAQKYIKFLSVNTHVNVNDLAYSLACSRSHFDTRLVVFSKSINELIKKLGKFSKVEPEKMCADSDLICSLDPWTSEMISNKMGRLEQAISLAQLYLEGKTSSRDFKDFFIGATIALPTYCFDETRYWPKLTVNQPKSIQEGIKEKFYDLRWRGEKLKNTLTLNKISYGNFIFITDGSQEHLSFVQKCKAKGIRAIPVTPGPDLEKAKSGWKMDYNNPAHYSQLIESIFKDEKQKLSGFIHMLECTKIRSVEEEVSLVQDSQAKGAFSLFHLVNAINYYMPTANCRLAYLSSFAMKILDQDHVNPTKMPGFGVCKVASQEIPLLDSIAIDLPLKELLNDTTSLFEEIFLTKEYQNGFVGYRSGKRYAQYVVKKPVKSPERYELIKEKGMYLIVGGSGYLGIQTALNLAKKESVQIILIGRKKKPNYSPQQKAAISEIKSLGSNLEYFQANVADEIQCKKIIKEIEKKYRKINGIFLAVKSISHKKLSEVDFDEFRTHIHSKLFSTFFLDKFTKNMNVDFMATFSSISSLTGGPTGADCCASNLFLDSYGPWKSKLGRETITMNFTLIEADDGSLLSDRMSMIPPLSKEEFHTCLDFCIGGRLKFSIMADFNSHVMKKVLPFMKVNFDQDLLKQFSGAKENTSFQEKPKNSQQKKEDNLFSIDEIQRLMKKIWGEVLGYDTIETDANFFEVGGESISAVKLIYMIETQMEIKIEIGDLYATPVFSDLCLTVFKRQGGENDTQDLSHILDDLDSGKIDISEATEAIEKS